MCPSDAAGGSDDFACSQRGVTDDINADVVNVFHESDGLVHTLPGIASARFADDVVEALLAPIPDADIEVKPGTSSFAAPLSPLIKA